MNSDWLNNFERAEWVELLRPLLETDVASSDLVARTHQFRNDLRAFQKQTTKEGGYRLSVKDGVTLIRMIGSEIEIGGRRDRFFGDFVSFLERFPHQSFLDAVVNQYGDCPPKQRADLLSLLACQEPKPAAQALKALIASHGFPDCYPRIFWYLRRNTAELGEYVVEFVRKPGRHIGDAVDLINLAIEKEHLLPAQLDELAPVVENKVGQLIDAAFAAQDAVRGRWRRDEAYFYLRMELGAYLDLMGIVPAIESQQLRNALRLEDPLISLFLATALIAKREEVPQSAILTSARSFETLGSLYRMLETKHCLHLFPKEYATFENFAAVEMVEWLLYPSELGEEPNEIELKNVMEGQDEEGRPQFWCLWRFTNHDDEAFAGISGPYDQEAVDTPTPKSVRSNSVFSNFTDWESASAEEHFGDITDTLSNWRITLCGNAD